MFQFKRIKLTKLLRCAASGELVLVTSAMVIAEIVWTMESFYELPREGIQASLDFHGTGND